MRRLRIGLNSWIVQDGNYRDFRVGQAACFALKFFPHALHAADLESPKCEHLWGSRYRVCAKVVYTAYPVWVIDFGFKAYENHSPPEIAAKGRWIEGEIYVGIDPFFYFEDLHAIPGIPELRYEVLIKGIELETTARIESKNDRGQITLTRDERQRSFMSLAETNAWEDDNGNAHYVLDCDVIGNIHP